MAVHKILTVVGARPRFVTASPVCRALAAAIAAAAPHSRPPEVDGDGSPAERIAEILSFRERA